VSLCQSITYTFFPQKQAGVYHNKPTATLEGEETLSNQNSGGAAMAFFARDLYILEHFFAVRLQNRNTNNQILF